MKIAVIYNRESKRVINLFGLPNREHYGKKAINRIVDALKKGGHSVKAFEGDRDLIDRLEEFMPGVLKHERPGMAFNLSYGVQGQARYTHVPGILEMVGIPYVGSGPLAHSLALDKVVAKMIFRQHGIPTPEFAVLTDRNSPIPDLPFPLIVKPKNESVSFGIKVVQTPEELKDAANAIFDAFEQHVLVERYIEGREINVGLLGNNPPEMFPPAEIIFGDSGPKIYTLEDKKGSSGRAIRVACPADLNAETIKQAQIIARQAFDALGCYDCARIDMRMDNNGNLYVLEVNSLPSLGEHGSYVAAAEAIGLDFPALVNRLVEVASARYFGTPSPPAVTPKGCKSDQAVFAHLTSRRDRIEVRLREWVSITSRTSDPVGRNMAGEKLSTFLSEMGMASIPGLEEESRLISAQSPKGYEGGTLLIGHLDSPVALGQTSQPFRRDPEWLYGEGIGSSRAPLVMMESALMALRAARQLRSLKLGVIYYTDEGNDCRYSRKAIQLAAKKAKRVLILKPGNMGNKVVTARRGQRKYSLTVEGKPLRVGHGGGRPGPLRWLFPKLEEISALTSRKDRIAVAIEDLHTQSFPELLPHRVTAVIIVSFPDEKKADELEGRIRASLNQGGSHWKLNLISDRPPMRDRRTNRTLLGELAEVAGEWDIPLADESSLWASVAGLVPASVPVVCGMGPIVRDLYTSQEAVNRVSLVQRTLLLAQYLLRTKGT